MIDFSNFKELVDVIQHYLHGDSDIETLFAAARDAREPYYGKRVFLRGLIEITNFCRQDCFYCGIRRSNTALRRYRLDCEQILECVRIGYTLGFSSFVLQGGEDMYYTDDIMANIVSSIKKELPDCAITLSMGEQSRESYQRYYDAGADRYLLRHETADAVHYSKLHPIGVTLENRKRCLYDLREIGFQTGAGFMVGSPYHTIENLAQDLIFLNELQPHMVGIGPFIPHNATLFKDFPAGGVKLTLIMIALCRIMLPKSMLPATTALASIDEHGREKAMFAGANVVMPNLSPYEYRADYSLYDNKLFTGSEAAEALAAIKKRIADIGYTPDLSMGHHYSYADMQKCK